MKSVAIHGALALFGLGLAYWAWAFEEPSDQTGEVLANCDTVSSLVFESARKRTTLTLEGDDARVVVEALAGASEGENETPIENQTFTGNDDVDTLIEKFAPLRALRSLGNLNDEALEEIGLDDTQDKLTVTCGGRDHEFEIGGSTFGSGDRYVRLTSGGPVHLVPAAVLRDLESAEFQLMQRELTSFAMSDADSLTINAEGRNKRLRQRNRLSPHTAEWVDAQEPDRRNELYGNWHRALRAVRANRYLDEGQAPEADAAEDGEAGVRHVVMQLTYAGENREALDVVQWVRVGEGNGAKYYARSNATRVWVRLPQSAAAQIERDARPILGLDPLPEPAPPAPEAPPSEATEEPEATTDPVTPTP